MHRPEPHVPPTGYTRRSITLMAPGRRVSIERDDAVRSRLPVQDADVVREVVEDHCTAFDHDDVLVRRTETSDRAIRSSCLTSRSWSFVEDVDVGALEECRRHTPT